MTNKRKDKKQHYGGLEQSLSQVKKLSTHERLESLIESLTGNSGRKSSWIHQKDKSGEAIERVIHGKGVV